jgi:hypothetical protein
VIDNDENLFGSYNEIELLFALYILICRQLQWCLPAGNVYMGLCFAEDAIYGTRFRRCRSPLRRRK